MSFGGDGKHRIYRSGGTNRRKMGEIFANTFQGKLSEYAVYNILYKYFHIKTPDISTYGLGEWDSCDFQVGCKTISVKSTKGYGNLLLLESKDWNSSGQYIPNIYKGCSDYDLFILVRIEPSCEDLLKNMNALYSDTINKDELFAMVMNKTWKYDIAGFVTKEFLMYAILNNHIIEKGKMLHGTRMDAKNIYIQSGDMRPYSEIVSFLYNH